MPIVYSDLPVVGQSIPEILGQGTITNERYGAGGCTPHGIGTRRLSNPDRHSLPPLSLRNASTRSTQGQMLLTVRSTGSG
ncbi:MAG TPA: hypothetical protein VN729_06615, partial [Ktedonobacteraceae bacterium]|nr:hypothetical protein [Ktedonobacteraceae bacterium]